MIVTVYSGDDVPENLTEADEEGFSEDRIMKQKGGAKARYVGGRGPCTAFRGVVGGDCRCNIYKRRPQVCVEFTPGSERCLEVRRDRGFVVEEA